MDKPWRLNIVMASLLQPWSTRAVNLPDHADNPIHTDEGAQAAGFKAAIVAGTTIYAYMTRPPAAAWGRQWLTQGGGELRLLLPVLDGENVDCKIDYEVNDPEPTVAATVANQTRATFKLWSTAVAPQMRDGDKLPTTRFVLERSQAEYGLRAGDDFALYQQLTTDESKPVAHPALWPSLANGIFATHLVTGAWIHTRSQIFHQGLAHAGDEIVIDATVVDRFHTKSGERAIVDIAIAANGAPVAQIEHEAIVRLSS